MSGICVKRIWRACALFLASLLLSHLSSPRALAQSVGPESLQVQDFGHLAPVPPMGWASWNHFFCDYDEQTIRQQADALVSSGMRDAGYKYVVIQECIARDRDANGNLIIDKVRFPSGMASLVEYIHHLGLKAGIYTDIGKHTCYPNPRYQGSYGHEDQDARSFAAWGIDFVEMDYCNREKEHTGRYVYEKMAAALKATGRPMVFYLCCWGNEQPWEWAQGKAQMWRTEFDISLEKNHVEWWRLVGNFESNTAHAVLSGPESWNDADMLEIGNPGLSDQEAQAQFSMWVMSPSPLLAGADLTKMSARTKQIYTNADAITIDQDPLGAGAELVRRKAPEVEIWMRPLQSRTGTDVAVLLLNATDLQTSMYVDWAELGLTGNVQARNVWTHQTLTGPKGISTSVAAHDAVLLRVHGVRDWKRGATFEAETPVNTRLGNASLFVCGECSHGYALALGGDGDEGGVRLTHIQVANAGTYQLQLLYVRNGLEDKTIDISVNGAAPQQVKAIMRSWNQVTVPVHLDSGDNTVEIRYRGAMSFYLDNVTVFAKEGR